MANGTTTFYIASSYLNKAEVNTLARELMDKMPDYWPTFPWWMFSQEEDKHHKHMGTIGQLEITGAGNANLFIFLKDARKGGWSELGAACYQSFHGAPIQIIMLLLEKDKDEYLPPFAYQPGVIRKYLPESYFDKPTKLVEVIASIREHQPGPQ